MNKINNNDKNKIILMRKLDRSFGLFGQFEHHKHNASNFIMLEKRRKSTADTLSNLAHVSNEILVLVNPEGTKTQKPFCHPVLTELYRSINIHQ